MALFAHERMTRRSWLLAGLGIPLFCARAGASLRVSFDGDDLHVTAPQLHFLGGPVLTRLENGNTVVLLAQIALSWASGGIPFRLSNERLTISRDVWDEKFSVVLAMAHRSATKLTMAAAENWCLDNLAISALGLENRPFWLQFDLRAASEKDLSSVVGDPGVSLRGLIELFGRKPGPDEPHWSFPVGPLRLAELPRTGRGSRNG